MTYNPEGLVGWTLGAYAGDDPNPPWTLAYVGCGLTGTGLGLAIWSDSVFEDAVEAHNESVRQTPQALLEWRGTSFAYAW